MHYGKAQNAQGIRYPLKRTKLCPFLATLPWINKCTILWYGTLVVWSPTWRGWKWTHMVSGWNFECFPIGFVVVVSWFLCCSLSLWIEWGEYLELVNPVRLVWPPSSDFICFLVNTVKEFCFQFSYFGESNQLSLWACFQCCHDNACCCISFLFLLCVSGVF